MICLCPNALSDCLLAMDSVYALFGITDVGGIVNELDDTS